MPSTLPGAPRLLVFIPAYHCAPQIGRVLVQLQALPPGLVEEILVVDNGSRDSTREAAIRGAEQCAVPVRVVQNRANYGLGGSHKAAFAYALERGFDFVAVLHGDDQGQIADLIPILTSELEDGCDAWLGSRFMRGSRLTGYPLTRVLGNHVFNALFSLATGRRLTDLGSGLNLFGRAVFADPAILHYADDLRFNCYLLLGLVAAHRRFRYFPIAWSEDDQVSNVKLASQSWGTLCLLAAYRFHRRRFLEADHRAVVRDAYCFDEVGANAAWRSRAQAVLA
jgi:glycosyltransferase involved in cell wall biosynthesis